MQPKCPACQSVDVTFEGNDRRAAILSVHALSLPVTLGSESWLCNHCGTRWQDVSETDTPSQ